jgi:hypothetical protein
MGQERRLGKWVVNGLERKKRKIGRGGKVLG